MKMEKNVTSTKEVKMLRDFTKSNKDYISKNKLPLMCVTLFLILGIVLFAIFGLNGNFELNGYNEFTIKAGADKSSYSKYAMKQVILLTRMVEIMMDIKFSVKETTPN